MNSTATHTVLFGHIYRYSKGSHVSRGIHLSIPVVSAVCTLKRLIGPFACIIADRTALGSVGRIYHDKPYPTQSQLVGHKSPELAERPTTRFPPEGFVPSLCPRPDMGQILQGNSLTLGFSGLDHTLGGGVVLKGGSGSFFALKPFQASGTASFTRPCLTPSAFALDSTPNLLSFYSILITPLGSMYDSLRSDCDVPQTKVYPDILLHLLSLRTRNLYGLAQQKLALPVHQSLFKLTKNGIVAPFPPSTKEGWVSLSPSFMKPLLKYSLSPLCLRLIIGFGFMAHGWAKISRGTAGFEKLLTLLGVPLPHLNALIAPYVELLGGGAILLGAWVVVAAVPLIITMLTAMLTIHIHFGFSSINTIGLTPEGPLFGPPGYELNLLYIAGLISLIFTGAGSFSIDYWVNRCKQSFPKT